MTITDPADDVLAGLQRARDDARRHCGTHYHLLVAPYAQMFMRMVMQCGGALTHPLAARLIYLPVRAGSWVVQTLAFSAAMDLLAAAALGLSRRETKLPLLRACRSDATHSCGRRAAPAEKTGAGGLVFSTASTRPHRLVGHVAGKGSVRVVASADWPAVRG